MTYRIRRLPLAMFMAALLIALPAHSEDGESDYPHGDFKDDCEKCHTSAGWTGAKIGLDFNHTLTGFPLVGSHQLTNCRACHDTLEFSLAEGTCVGCHLDVHQSELGADCGRCHTARSFIDRSGMARAHLTTRFPLRGAHRVTDCDDCHRPGSPGSLQYVNTPVNCDACHLDAYLATNDPDHQANGFPRSCENCHRADGWIPARFDHAGLAAGAACVSCHLDDYQSTVDPDHQASGYSQNCEICHSTRRWVPSAFDGLNHDSLFFPIFSGKHRNKWNQCTDCHVVPNSFAQFSCINCHAHDDPVKAADQHSEEPGYTYDSQACLNCHPQGSH